MGSAVEGLETFLLRADGDNVSMEVGGERLPRSGVGSAVAGREFFRRGVDGVSLSEEVPFDEFLRVNDERRSECLLCRLEALFALESRLDRDGGMGLEVSTSKGDIARKDGREGLGCAMRSSSKDN